MASFTDDHKPAWYESRRLQWIALSILVALAVGEGAVGILLKDNDFLWHRHLGEGFLEGDPYANGGDHYLPARTMVNALTAWLPYRVDRAVIYVLSLAALAWTLRAWNQLGNKNRPLKKETAWAAILFTLAICGAYIQRDLDDCGLQLLLLFMLTAAAVRLQAGSDRGCGFWLGLAAVYKLTPVLFLPYLIYKRQWRTALWMGVFMSGFCLAPALWLGWDENRKAHEHWLASAKNSLGIQDPSENGVEPPNHRNQSLTLALARLVQTYPPGHVLHMDHPLFLQFGNLEPAIAKQVVQGLLLVLAGALAWRFRKSLANSAGTWQREWAAVIILTAILSPLCWVQHLVLVIPAVYLDVRAALEVDGLSPWQRRIGWMVAAIMLFACQRDLFGQGLFMVGMSYKVHTWAALAALFLVLNLRETRPVLAILSMEKGQGRTSVRPCRSDESKSA